MGKLCTLTLSAKLDILRTPILQHVHALGKKSRSHDVPHELKEVDKLLENPPDHHFIPETQI